MTAFGDVDVENRDRSVPISTLHSTGTPDMPNADRGGSKPRSRARGGKRMGRGAPSRLNSDRSEAPIDAEVAEGAKSATPSHLPIFIFGSIDRTQSNSSITMPIAMWVSVTSCRPLPRLKI